MADINFSIVIPLYNKQSAIVATLQSVLAQTYTNYEIIVVDDGSTDGSAEVAEAILQECTVYGVECKGKVIRKANGGVCSARNRGIQEAKYDYVALLDGDDLWDEHYLEEQVKLIQDFPEAKMWGVNYAFVKNGNTQKCYQGLGENYRGYVNNYFSTSHNDLFCSSSVVIKKDAFDIVGYFDENIAYSEDLDMWYRIILHYPVAFYDKVFAFYNQDADNRCAYDLNIHYDLTRYLPYHIDKYQYEFDNNKQFSRYLCTRAAVTLLKEGYYFGISEDQKKADKVVKYLRYEDIHPKYRFIFKTPRFIGKLIYKLVCFKKSIQK
ncbi:MAG: glycosyltransferase family 2 protein [Alistipes sp.]|nr:glycosyltransferase family 2 protein [Alistipes sp.]MBR6550679.1 glycosyltransferase family 2 protein [Paludibacteraceae bacterium]